MNLFTLKELPSPSMLSRIVASILALGFLVVGISEFLSPTGWDLSFGVPLTGGSGLSYIQALGARNTGLSLLALFTAITGMRAALASVFLIISLIAAMDFCTVSMAVGAELALKHAMFVVLMAAISIWIMLSKKS